MMLYRRANLFCISCTIFFYCLHQLNKMREFCFFPITKHFCRFSINNKKPQHTVENIPLLAVCTDICNNFFHLQSRIASGTLRSQWISALSCALESYTLRFFFSVQFNVQLCIHFLALGTVVTGSSKGYQGAVLREHNKKQTYLCLLIR